MRVLGALQEQFCKVLLEPQEFSKLVPHLRQADLLEDRFAFYRGNLAEHWNGALKNAYPVLEQLVGADFFAQMAKAYGHDYPSDSGDLNTFGSQLPEFLAQHPKLEEYPYFCEVARLEWQIHSAYYAKDAPYLSFPNMIRQTNEFGLSLDELHLQVHPAVSFFDSPWAALDIWFAHQTEGDVQAIGAIKRCNYGLVSRPQWQAQALSLGREEWLALHALAQGEMLERALEIALEANPVFDIGAHLPRWFAAGAFSAIHILK